jgi:hypothetical protein
VQRRCLEGVHCAVEIIIYVGYYCLLRCRKLLFTYEIIVYYLHKKLLRNGRATHTHTRAPACVGRQHNKDKPHVGTMALELPYDVGVIVEGSPVGSSPPVLIPYICWYLAVFKILAHRQYIPLYAQTTASARAPPHHNAGPFSPPPYAYPTPAGGEGGPCRLPASVERERPLSHGSSVHHV